MVVMAVVKREMSERYLLCLSYMLKAELASLWLRLQAASHAFIIWIVFLLDCVCVLLSGGRSLVD